MGRKETTAVLLMCGFTTILKIYSIVTLYHIKTVDRSPEERTELSYNHTLYNNVFIVGDATLTIDTEQEAQFKPTFIE